MFQSQKNTSQNCTNLSASTLKYENYLELETCIFESITIKMRYNILAAAVFLAVVYISTVKSAPSHSLEAELGSRGATLDHQVEEIDKLIYNNWNTLIGPLSSADKAAFRRQYPDEAEEYDKITEYYKWPKKF